MEVKKHDNNIKCETHEEDDDDDEGDGILSGSQFFLIVRA